MSPNNTNIQRIDIEPTDNVHNKYDQLPNHKSEIDGNQQIHNNHNDNIDKISNTINNNVIIHLCIVSFLLGYKPSEPYLTNILIDDKHLTEQQVNQSVYPIYVYSYMLSMLPMILCSIYIGYKYTLIICCISRELTRILLVFCSSLLSMQLMQITFGIAQVDTILLPIYIYTIYNYNTIQYTKVVGLYYSFEILGHAMAGITGQIAVTYFNMSYMTLLIVSTVSVSIGSLLLVLKLPNDKTIINDVSNNRSEQVTTTCNNSILSIISIKLSELYNLYFTSVTDILIWSICFLPVWGSYDIVAGYCMSLYYEITTLNNTVMNYQALSDTVARLCAAGFALMPGYINHLYFSNIQLNAIVWCIIILTIMCVTLILFALCTSLYIAYMYNAIYASISAFFVTLSTSYISVHMSVIQFAVVFAVNRFCATIIQSIILFIGSDSVLRLSAKQLFLVCSGQLAVTAIICAVALVRHLIPSKVDNTNITNKYETSYDEEDTVL